MSLLNKCCFFISLRIGALCIGIYYVLLIPIIYCTKIRGEMYPDKSSETGFLCIIVLGLLVIASVILIVTAVLKKPIYAIPWLLASFIYFIFHIFLLIRFIVNYDGKFFAPISIVVHLALMAYFWVCVYSYYKHQEVEEI